MTATVEALHYVEITGHHIVEARGGAQDASHCAIAYALAQEVGGLHIRVTDKKITWTDPKTRRRFEFQTPEEAIRFIHQWDAWAAGKRKTSPRPFTLVLTEDDLLKVREKPVRKPERIIKSVTAKKKKAKKVARKPRNHREIPEYVTP